MVSVDTVYQKVLALANKEQRGYITPQEFNLFANQAQKEIFEQYFYDVNQFRRIPGNDTVYSDVDDMLEEKLQIFESVDNAIVVGSWANAINPLFKILPDYIYRVSRVELSSVNCEIMNTKDFNEVDQSPLLSPTSARPVANVRDNIMKCKIGAGSFVVPTDVFYFRIPAAVSWTYFVVGSKALFDANNPSMVDFELHPSEETELVYKILKFAGISMKRDDIMKAGQGLESTQVSQEKQ